MLFALRGGAALDGDSPRALAKRPDQPAVGRQTAEFLFDRVDPAEVVLVTRDPSKLADLAERGADVRAGDFDDPASLEAAFAGGERLLLISTDKVGARVPQHQAAVDAAKAAGVRHVIYTSLPDPSEGNPALVATDHRETEALIEASGLDWTFLRNSMYTDLRAGELEGARNTGKLFHNAGSGRVALVSREDCAAAAAGALAAGGLAGERLDVTGPELLDAAGIAAVYADILGSEVEAVELDDDAMKAALVDNGLPEEAAVLIASFGTAVREGYLDQQTDVVARLAGREPQPAREVLSSSSSER